MSAFHATVSEFALEQIWLKGKTTLELNTYCLNVFHPFDSPGNSKGCYSVAKETQDMSVIGSAVSRQPALAQTHTQDIMMPSLLQKHCASALGLQQNPLHSIPASKPVHVEEEVANNRHTLFSQFCNYSVIDG